MVGEAPDPKVRDAQDTARADEPYVTLMKGNVLFHFSGKLLLHITMVTVLDLVKKGGQEISRSNFENNAKAVFQ